MAKNPYTEARREANRTWDAAHLESVSARLPIGYRERLKARATESGMSLNSYLRALYDAALAGQVPDL